MHGSNPQPFWHDYTRNVEEVQQNLSPRPSGPALRFVAAALIVRGGEILIGQRRPNQALARELDEELGIRAEIGPRVTHVRHNYRHGGAVDLQFFAVREFSGEIEGRIYHQVRWVRLEDLGSYEFLAADRGLIRDLVAGKLL